MQKQAFFLKIITNIFMFVGLNNIEMPLSRSKYCLNLKVLIFNLKKIHLLHKLETCISLHSFYWQKLALRALSFIRFYK